MYDITCTTHARIIQRLKSTKSLAGSGGPMGIPKNSRAWWARQRQAATPKRRTDLQRRPPLTVDDVASEEHGHTRKHDIDAFVLAFGSYG
eukprot:48967-Pyramimonas_sp.AAC.1